MKKWLLSSLLIFLGITLFAADNNIIDLLKALSSSKKDTARVSALMNLGAYYMYRNADSGIYFYEEALRLSKELKYSSGIVWAIKQIGEVYENDGDKTAAMRNYKQVAGILDSTGYDNYFFRIAFLNSLYAYYQVSQPDSSLYYGNLVVELARRQKDKYEEAVALSKMAYSVYLVGNYPFALELNFRSVELFERIKKEDFLKDIYFQIGMIFEAQENFPQALENFFKSYKLAAPTKDGLLMFIFMHLGICYVGTNQLDSAMKYSSVALEIFSKVHDNKYKGAMLKNIGVVYEKKGDDTMALSYFRMAINHDKNQKREYLLSMDYIALAKYFFKNNYYDSCLYYANEASILALHSSVIKNIMDASELLTKAYQAKNQIDSAFKYQGIRLMAKDSLFSQEKVRHIQLLSYKEDQRQKQVADEKELALEERKKNLQLIGISVFILSFLLFVLLLSRKHIRPRTVEFFGVTALLMLFEFISLFIHPYIEVLTHHSQVEMLMILVGIAAVLVPMHHRMEKWVKQSLARKKLQQHELQSKEVEIAAVPLFVERKAPIK